ncbi:acyl-CoA synthetase [soil metagenome]
MPELSLVQAAREHSRAVAVAAPEGVFTYADLLTSSARIAGALLDGADDLNEARVTFVAAPGWEYVAAQWGIWRAGGIAVPLAVSHPIPEQEYVVEDADSSIVLLGSGAGAGLEEVAKRHRRRCTRIVDALGAEAVILPEIDPLRRAMMVYTSGTTGKPKGVVTTHRALMAQVESLVTAWEWSRDDATLLVLPLHHVHGIVNVLTCALRVGARCEIHAEFDPEQVWRRLSSGQLTLFMAVPTIYRRLISAWEGAPVDQRESWSDGAARLRLMVSGSAALPIPTLEGWREITGHTLLERYGMTEIGMALSNPLRGERRPGTVGMPLPGVEIRLTAEGDAPLGEGEPGEIEVRGATVFHEYWKRPAATAEAFRDGGWFSTGDVAIVEDGYYRILGRRSVDIIKTGGYKVSALEIEAVLRLHPMVAECAVVGVEDPDWGQRICVALELRAATELPLEELQQWARERLAPYKIPRALRSVDALPRNPMGKVIKPEVSRLFGAASPAIGPEACS